MLRAVGIERDIFTELTKSFRSRRSGMNDKSGLPSCTYILKDRNSEAYKVGIASDLHKRFLALKQLHPYCEYDLVVFAYSLNYYEECLIDALIRSGARLASPHSREMFLLTDEDMQYIINLCGFIMVEDNGLMPYTISEEGVVTFGPYPRSNKKNA